MARKKNILELTRCTADEYRGLKKINLKVLTDNVRSMHNIGSIFRTADAFLIDEIILGGISGIPPHPEISKTALGAEDTVSWRHVEESLAEMRRLKSEGWKICVLEQAHNSIPLSDFTVERDEKVVLVVGNEVKGVSQEIVDEADYVVEIPQYGTKHSLNVSVSAGIGIWSIFLKLI